MQTFGQTTAENNKCTESRTNVGIGGTAAYRKGESERDGHAKTGTAKRGTNFINRHATRVCFEMCYNV